MPEQTKPKTPPTPATTKTILIIIITIILLGAAYLVYMIFFYTSPNPPINQTNINQNISVQTNANLNEDNCRQLEEQITALISAANYCQEDSDCVIGKGYLCPFGCYSLYNKAADLSRIKAAIAEYDQVCPKCAPECIPTPETKDVKCRAGKCVNTELDHIMNQ